MDGRRPTTEEPRGSGPTDVMPAPPAVRAAPSSQGTAQGTSHGTAQGAEPCLASAWCDLPISPLAPSVARRWVSAMLGSWGLRPPPPDEATLAELTSELVTNAVQHAKHHPCDGHGFKINLTEVHGKVRLAVHDPDPTLPTPQTPDYAAQSGRGLFLVDVQADQWGAVQYEDGKYVWFSLDCHTGEAGADAPSPSSTLTASHSTASSKENPVCPPSSSPTTSTAQGRTA